ncbi:MAG: ABC transporter ATP-binding protein [Thaumarchaeota archaeon]|nr:ABC transporter ATP-binding protein [Nitrososphaerota archaeon]
MEASLDPDGPILTTVSLSKYYPIRRKFLSRAPRRFVRAVDDVSIQLPRRKTTAVVGESGCGKTTLARTVTMLVPPTKGQVFFEGKEISQRKNQNWKEIYRDIQMVFQDPDSSLDPRFKVKESVGEPLRGLLGANGEVTKQQVDESLAAVGLSAEQADRLPGQLSGGQKQRVAIARAIATKPKLVVLDEPTSALDASVQAQILKLLLSLQRKFELSYMLITHNIAVAQYLSDNIAVMYTGNLVEYGPTKSVLQKPRHPYTITLIASAPIPNPWKRNLLTAEIKGEVPSAINPPSGCRFHPRCPYAEKICAEVNPQLEPVSPGHYVACHFVNKTA